MNLKKGGQSVKHWGAVILAAGKSKRMKTTVPKVLHRLCGRALIDYVLDAVNGVGIRDRDVCIVVGFGSDQVREHLRQRPELQFVVQEQQLGTGHAVACARDFLEQSDRPVLVLAGDMPLITADSLKELTAEFERAGAACAIGTAHVRDPYGLGRIVRDSAGRFSRIVEEADATEEEKRIAEINTSIYVFASGPLNKALSELRPDNQQGELYLTDCPAILQQWGKTVIAVPAFSDDEAMGVNSRAELARAHRIMQERIVRHWQEQGVTVLDPNTVYIDARVDIGPDTVILPFSYLDGPATVGRACTIGPFAYLAPGTVVADGTRLGPNVRTG